MSGMTMTRVYKITIAELIVLREVLSEYGRELGCDQCGDDFCAHCQRNYDLRQKIVDAESLAEVGCTVVFTTAAADTTPEGRKR
jgi:hypothetical protein